MLVLAKSRRSWTSSFDLEIRWFDTRNARTTYFSSRAHHDKRVFTMRHLQSSMENCKFYICPKILTCDAETFIESQKHFDSHFTLALFFRRLFCPVFLQKRKLSNFSLPPPSLSFPTPFQSLSLKSRYRFIKSPRINHTSFCNFQQIHWHYYLLFFV